MTVPAAAPTRVGADEAREVRHAVERVLGAPRGGHRADCTEVVVLVVGSATIDVRRPESGATQHRLERPGRSVTLHAGDHVDDTLGGAGSVVMVLCDAPYQGER